MRSFGRDSRGTTAIEFAFVFPLFIAASLGFVAAGMALSMQIALQHGVDAAARCGGVNKQTCGTTEQIAQYASQHAYGMTFPTSVFKVQPEACGLKVTAAYAIELLPTYFGSISLSAASCFPT